LPTELGVNQITVSDYETGAARIHAAMLAALARVLHVSADELIGLTSTRAPRTAPDRRFLRRMGTGVAAPFDRARDTAWGCADVLAPPRLHQSSRRDQRALVGTIDACLGRVS
jgi:transcriptional regulator with XRE-family HTH domain